MTHLKYILFLILLTSCLMCSCVTLKMVSVDQKTELENQILGSINSLQDDLVLMSSVRGNNKQQSIPPAHREALYSVMNRQYNLDDVNALKQQGIAGEATNGLLQFFETNQTQNSKSYEEFARRIIKEENNDRSIIMKRVISINQNLTPDDKKLVQKIMHKLNVQSSPENTKVENISGQWTTLSANEPQL